MGIGAAATTAAWTDNVWFQAAAGAATFNLEGNARAGAGGQPDPGGWVEGATSAAAIVVPGDAFDNLQPGEAASAEVYVRNDPDSTVATSLVVNLPTVVTGSGTLFDALTIGTHVTVSSDTVGPLDPGEHATITITITPPADWATSYQGSTGTLLLQVEGEAVA